MRKVVTLEDSLKSLFIFLLAFVLTYKAPIRYLEYHGKLGLAHLLSSVSIYSVFIIALILVILRKDYSKYILCICCFFGLLYIYQKTVVPSEALSNYWPSFYYNGIVGCVCGVTLSEPKKLIIYTGFLSLVYGILLIPEPITGNLLGYSSMTLGYTMAPLTIWITLLWYYAKKYKKLLKVIAILIGTMTVLFTSRGCGISVIALAIIIIIIDTKKKHNSISIKFSIITIIIITGILILREFTSYFIINSNIPILHGSTLDKLMTGMISDDNGRIEILTLAVELYKSNWITGVGMGKDRQIIGYVYPHNIFIEILLHFGLIVTIIIMICYWKPIIKSIRLSFYSDYAVIIPAFCCLYWVRLLFSDSYLNNSFGLMFVYGFALQIIIKQRKSQIYE